MASKTHLGDGVYARLDEHGAVVLTTENGIEATNTIVLEADVAVALIEWLEPHTLVIADALVRIAEKGRSR